MDQTGLPDQYSVCKKRHRRSRITTQHHQGSPTPTCDWFQHCQPQQYLRLSPCPLWRFQTSPLPLQPVKKGDAVWWYRVLGGNVNQDSMWWRRRPSRGKGYLLSCWPSHIECCHLNPLTTNCGAGGSTGLLLGTGYCIVPKVIVLQVSPCWKILRTQMRGSPHLPWNATLQGVLLCFLHRMMQELVPGEPPLQVVLTANSWHIPLTQVPEQPLCFNSEQGNNFSASSVCISWMRSSGLAFENVR